LYGSLALEAFVPEASDIDFVTMMNRELTKEEGTKLQSIHKQLRKEPLGKRMDRMYISITDLGKDNKEQASYLSCARLLKNVLYPSCTKRITVKDTLPAMPSIIAI
jgi:hypothetical protein